MSVSIIKELLKKIIVDHKELFIINQNVQFRFLIECVFIILVWGLVYLFYQKSSSESIIFDVIRRFR